MNEDEKKFDGIVDKILSGKMSLTGRSMDTREVSKRMDDLNALVSVEHELRKEDLAKIFGVKLGKAITPFTTVMHADFSNFERRIQEVRNILASPGSMEGHRVLILDSYANITKSAVDSLRKHPAILIKSLPNFGITADDLAVEVDPKQRQKNLVASMNKVRGVPQNKEHLAGNGNRQERRANKADAKRRNKRRGK